MKNDLGYDHSSSPLMFITSVMFDICGAIKKNESELEHIIFLVVFVLDVILHSQSYVL